MKVLLRSVLAVGKDNTDELFRNYLGLEDSGIGFDTPEDVLIYKYVRDFARAHNHVPDMAVVRANFEHRQEAEVIDRLEVIGALPGVFKGNFEKRLEGQVTKRKTLLVQDILQDAAVIVKMGLEVKDEKWGSKKEPTRLFGPVDAMRYVNDKAHSILTPTLGGRLFGEATKDGEDFLKDFKLRKLDPSTGIGQFTGLDQADRALKGAKRGELWTHAGFTGALKSTIMLNWAYNQAVYYGHGSLIFSLEMPYPQVRRILYAMHSMHSKFANVRMQLGLQADPSMHTCLPYEGIRDGTLTPAQLMFMTDIVVPDFGEAANDYGKIHIEVPNPDKSDFTVADLRTRAEVLYSTDPFRTIFVDHMGLMSPRKWVPSTTERLNEIVRDLKRLAMGFHRGQGIAVVNLSQLSRDGWRGAAKKDDAEQEKGVAPSGRYYNLTNLSYSNEIERSSDIVTTTYLNDQMRLDGRVWIQCLKSRDQKAFEPFLARIDWPCRRLKTILVADGDGADSLSESDLDNIG